MDWTYCDVEEFIRWVGDVGLEYKDRAGWISRWSPEVDKELRAVNGLLDLLVVKMRQEHAQQLSDQHADPLYEEKEV